MTTRFRSDNSALDGLYGELADRELQPLWELAGLLPPEPSARAVPFHWQAKDLRRLAERAGDLVPVERGGDRRVLACANPGLGGAPFAVPTLWAAMQYLKPGELAPAHRHTPAALRFVLEGSAVWTVVNGDPLAMSEGDLILTPSWTFHEHHNAGTSAMSWLDVLDLPIVAALDAVFYQAGTDRTASLPTDPASRSERWFGGGSGLLPPPDLSPDPPARHSPLLAYRWADTHTALSAQLDASGGDTARLRYTDPARGCDVMPTMRCEIERLLPGSATTAARQTGSRVACVLHGTGRATVGDDEFEVEPGDIIAVPSWSRWRLTAKERLDVFSVSDAPVLEALGLFHSSPC